MIIFGLEGTAWNLSAALVDESGVICEKSATYVPAKGGIHPDHRDGGEHYAHLRPRDWRTGQHRCGGRLRFDLRSQPENGAPA